MHVLTVFDIVHVINRWFSNTKYEMNRIRIWSLGRRHYMSNKTWIFYSISHMIRLKIILTKNINLTINLFLLFQQHFVFLDCIHNNSRIKTIITPAWDFIIYFSFTFLVIEIVIRFRRKFFTAIILIKTL